jgi:acetyltransferase-like isoleucine patch superfamily enzyme
MITIVEQFPGENQISIAAEFIERGAGKITVSGKGNIIRIDRPHFIGPFWLTVADECDVAIEEATTMNEMSIYMGQPSKLRIGKRTSFNVRCVINMHESACISIGEDCLFAPDVSVSSSNVHKIYDATTRVRINAPGDVVIGDRVWVSANSTLWGGAAVGTGSVVAFGSFVNKDFPPNCVIGGTPARLLREGIYWEP